MEKINSTDDLKNAIKLLEAQHAVRGKELKDHFKASMESLLPSMTKMLILNKFIGIAAGMASGYFSRRLIVKAPTKLLGSIFGSVLQYGVTNAFLNNSNTTLGKIIRKYLVKKKSVNSEEVI